MLFEQKEISLLATIAQRTITKVLYYHWTTNNASEDYQCLDYIELHLSGDKKIVFSHGEESQGIEISDSFDLEAENKKLKERFNGQISLTRENATIDAIWLPTVEMPIQDIKINQANPGHFSRHFVIIVFNPDYQIEIAPAEEGLNVDYYEEV